MQQKTQTFNDGTASIFSIKNVAESGDKPKNKLTLKVAYLRYHERIVGISRYWSGIQAKANIVRLLRMPKITSVSSQDIVILPDGEQYKIAQVQYPEDIYPRVMDLSLERVDADYGIAET